MLLPGDYVADAAGSAAKFGQEAAADAAQATKEYAAAGAQKTQEAAAGAARLTKEYAAAGAQKTQEVYNEYVR